MIDTELEIMKEEFDARDTHIPVMPQEIMEYLDLPYKGCVLDGTLGMGGHAELILKRIGPNGRLIALDRDEESLNLARNRLKEYQNQCDFFNEDFRNIDLILNRLGIKELDGIILDLGISSYQLNQPQRGFSFLSDGPLDMRMDQTAFISANDLVNSLSEKEIGLILKNYGQERYSQRIARGIVWQRSKRPIASTQELATIILRSLPHQRHWQKIHPATRSFQAFRIAVNREFEALNLSLEKCIQYLKRGRRMVVLSFHSLEDRIVKCKFREFAKQKTCELILKKPLRPTEEEIVINPRCRSARLRVVKKLS